jgi:hypothetical protein
VKKDEQKAAGPPKAPCLFDTPAAVSASTTSPADSDEEAEILAEMKQDEETEEDEAFVVS